MGYWVNKDSYSSGKRHYFEDGAQNVTFDYESNNGVSHWTVKPYGKALCGQLIANTKRTWKDPRTGKDREDGGLSYRDEKKVKLTQGNLCHYCRTAYINARPELKEALEALGVY